MSARFLPQVRQREGDGGGEEEGDFFDAFRSLDWKLNIYSSSCKEGSARANESTRKGQASVAIFLRGLN